MTISCLIGYGRLIDKVGSDSDTPIWALSLERKIAPPPALPLSRSYQTPKVIDPSGPCPVTHGPQTCSWCVSAWEVNGPLANATYNFRNALSEGVRHFRSVVMPRPVHADQCACAPMLYISELCEDCTVADEIDYEIDYMRGPASMTTDTWSRRVTSDFYSALGYELSKRELVIMGNDNYEEWKTLTKRWGRGVVRFAQIDFRIRFTENRVQSCRRCWKLSIFLSWATRITKNGPDTGLLLGEGALGQLPSLQN